jgi:hypothetical protein
MGHRYHGGNGTIDDVDDLVLQTSTRSYGVIGGGWIVALCLHGEQSCLDDDGEHKNEHLIRGSVGTTWDSS